MLCTKVHSSLTQEERKMMLDMVSSFFRSNGILDRNGPQMKMVRKIHDVWKVSIVTSIALRRNSSMNHRKKIHAFSLPYTYITYLPKSGEKQGVGEITRWLEDLPEPPSTNDSSFSSTRYEEKTDTMVNLSC
jgi:hypothetical protein